ncbi:WD40 repeat-like protein [Wallemia mellicola CBS 633.66]|uniref:WD40 repeat-like protein n=1 Tax=Wallemia mellicola (strain ATCC MYA-4683 / CBS 633.66) TaxID=671144 RepID=I4Y7V6_WALMC|nr:WD40 repeat-like protein [Wallemia mellicola CBS 633.66]EIM20048.1 WD40 repeat-like protein [Wallemia mellicola CBS 633.66]|eukprot:XP_006959977.1 WD40 repeat-like protein [Wallemia mellicola CBS 633.66]
MASLTNQGDFPYDVQFPSRGILPPDFKAWGSASARAHKDRVNAVGWSNDGKRLGSVSSDKSLRIWPEKALDSGRPDAKMATAMIGHSDKVVQLAWHPLDSNLLTTVSLDKTIRCWDIRARAPTTTLQLSSAAYNLAYHPDGQTLAAGAETIGFYDLRHPTGPQRTIERQQQADRINHDFRWSKDGELFTICCNDGSFEAYLYPSFELEFSDKGHTSDATKIEFTKDRRYMLTGGGDAVVNVWDLEEWICLRSINQIEGLVRSISVNSISECVAIGTDDRNISIASIHTGETLHSFKTGAKTKSLAWHPSKLLLAYASEDITREEHMREPGMMNISSSVRVWGKGVGRPSA